MRNSKYTREFRDSTVQLVVNGGKSALQVARELDINSKVANSGCFSKLSVKNFIQLDQVI